MVNSVSYDQTMSLQAPFQNVLRCPAILETNSAALRYNFREHDMDKIFRLRPVGNSLTLPQTDNNGLPQTIHLLITRSTPLCPMTADVLFSCLEHLKVVIIEHDAFEVHLSIIDPESPLCYCYGLYSCMMDLVVETTLSKSTFRTHYPSLLKIFTPCFCFFTSM